MTIGPFLVVPEGCGRRRAGPRGAARRASGRRWQPVSTPYSPLPASHERASRSGDRVVDLGTGAGFWPWRPAARGAAVVPDNETSPSKWRGQPGANGLADQIEVPRRGLARLRLGPFDLGNIGASTISASSDLAGAPGARRPRHPRRPLIEDGQSFSSPPPAPDWSSWKNPLPPLVPLVLAASRTLDHQAYSVHLWLRGSPWGGCRPATGAVAGGCGCGPSRSAPESRRPSAGRPRERASRRVGPAPACLGQRRVAGPIRAGRTRAPNCSPERPEQS